MDYTREDFKRELARLEKLAKDGALNDIGLGKLEMANSVENLILPVVGVTFKEKEIPEVDSFIIMRGKEEKDDFIIFKGKKYTIEEFTIYRKQKID